MKEIGLRILLASIAREAAKYDKGIQPILSYVSDHYFRTYIRIFNGIIHSNRSISNVSIIPAHKLPMSESCDDLIGPLWMEKLHEKKIIGEVRSILSQKTCNTKHVLWKLFDLLEEEADAPPFFYTTNYLASRRKVQVPSIKNIIYRLQKKGFPVFRTQFNPIGFKTNAPLSEIVKMFKT
jgi:tRNA (guanine26-N2/guanine27-N2)-dimethyltransferase